MSSDFDLQGCIRADPDISGIGVRIAIYAQNLLCFLPVLFHLRDKYVQKAELASVKTQSIGILTIAYAILISAIIQAKQTNGLSKYHANIILGLSWMNNTSTFIWFLLRAHHLSKPPPGEVLGAKPTTIRTWWNALVTPTFTGVPNAASALQKIDRFLKFHVVLILGSLHLSIMGAIGIWLWSNPNKFGTPMNVACDPLITILGFLELSFSSHRLRGLSLLLYATVTIPGVYLLLPFTIFLAPHVLWNAFSKRKSMIVLYIGLVLLLIINIIFIVDIELTIRRNKHLRDDGETKWGFGQVLALCLLAVPIRDLVTAIIFARQQAIKRRDQEAAKAATEKAYADERQRRDREFNANMAALGETHRQQMRTREQEQLTLRRQREQEYAAEAAAQKKDYNQKRTQTLFEEALHQLFNTKGSDVRTLIHAGADPNTVVKVTGENAEHAQLCLLHYAVHHRDTGLIKFLLDDKRTNINIHEELQASVSPLYYAFSNQDWDNLAYLLEHGVKLDVKRHIVSFDQVVLKQASTSGNARLLNAFLGADADHIVNMNSTDDSGDTALHLAVRKCHTDIVKLLLLRQCDLNLKNNAGETALLLAASTKQWDIVQLIAETGNADAKIVYPNGITALHYAAQFGHLGTAAVILGGCRADPNQADKHGSTPLHLSSTAGHLEVARLLLQQPELDINAKNREGKTPLLSAASSKQWEIIQILAQGNSLDPRVINQKGWTALHYAAESGRYDIIAVLLAKGADGNARTNLGCTALLFAAFTKGWETVRALAQQKDIDVGAASDDGWTALHIASQCGELSVVEILLERGSAPAVQIEDGYTPLLLASKEGHLGVVKELLKCQDPCVNQGTTKEGLTALHYASARGHSEVVKELLDRQDVDVNQRTGSADGKTAFHYACSRGTLEVVKEFLKRQDVDVNARDEYGQTPFISAVAKKQWEIVQFLAQRNNVDVAVARNDGWTALAFGIQAEETHIVKLLLDNGADVRKTRADGGTPLHLACQHKNPEVVKELLRHPDLRSSSHINSLNKNGETPLICAAQVVHGEVVRIMLQDSRVDPTITDNQGKTAVEHAREQLNYPDFRSRMDAKGLLEDEFKRRLLREYDEHERSVRKKFQEEQHANRSGGKTSSFGNFWPFSKG